MDELRRELASLVDDALCLISPGRKPTPLQDKPNSKTIPSSKKQSEPVRVQESPSPSKWALSSLPTTSSPLASFEKYLDTSHESECVVALILSDEEYRELLESITSAISRHFLPSQVVPAADTLPKTVKWVLAPLSHMNRHFEGGMVHRVTRHEERYYLPMHELSEYQNDRNLKLSLWNTLKTLFQDTPQSS